MKLKTKIVLLMILTAIQLPCAGYAAEEDKELSLIAAEQENSGEDEQLGEINPALTESISTERTQETDKEIKERKKKLKQARKEKEKLNEQKLKKSTNQKETQSKEEPVVIEPTKTEPPPPEPTPQPARKPESQPIIEPIPQPDRKPESQPITEPTPQPARKPESQPIIEPSTPLSPPPQTVETVALPNQKLIYANFAEVARRNSLPKRFVKRHVPNCHGFGEDKFFRIGKGNHLVEFAAV